MQEVTIRHEMECDEDTYWYKCVFDKDYNEQLYLKLLGFPQYELEKYEDDGETIRRDGVEVTLAPAGHVLGSAQAVVRWKGMTVVCSGDYKRRPDPTCVPFEPVACDVFITEATFGLPVFRHPPDHEEIGKLLRSVEQFPERAHLVGAYALGKAQRVISLIRRAGYAETIYVHGALLRLNRLYERHGVALGPLAPATAEGRAAKGAAVSRSPARLRVGLDGGAGPRPPTRDRAAAGHLRPCRLGRADRHHRRGRAERALDHPRP